MYIGNRKSRRRGGARGEWNSCHKEATQSGELGTSGRGLQVNVGLDWLSADARNVSEQPDGGGRNFERERQSKLERVDGNVAPEREWRPRR